jgi:hypothetical protein
MPYFIKGLGDIKEGCGAVGFVFKSFIDFVDDAMYLFSGGVSLPEAELWEGINALCSTIGRRCARSSFSRTLDTIGRRLIGR